MTVSLGPESVKRSRDMARLLSMRLVAAAGAAWRALRSMTIGTAPARER